MAEFVGEEKRCIAEGEQVFINQTSQCLSITTGISFNRDGDYFVSVHGGRVIVTEEPVGHGKPCDDCQEFDCYGCKYAERKEE